MDIRLPRALRALLRPATRHGWVPDRIWWRLPVSGTFTVRVAGGSFRYVAAESDVIGRSLHWRGLDAWESQVLREFVPRARAARGFLDIGANTGVYTLVATAVNPSLRVLAFEPSPEVGRRLAEHVDLNGLRARVQVIPAAVSDTTGTRRLFVPDGHPDMSFLEGVQQPRGPGRWVTVETVAGGVAVPDDMPVDLVKIDVEGAEGEVLESLAPVLQRHRPAIVIELLPEGGHQQVLPRLRAAGYRIGRITGAGVDWASAVPLVGDPNNFLCEPE